LFGIFHRSRALRNQVARLEVCDLEREGEVQDNTQDRGHRCFAASGPTSR